MRALPAVMAVVVASSLLAFGSAAAEASRGNCSTSSSLEDASTECTFSYDDLAGVVETAPQSVYSLFQACVSGTSGEPEPCARPNACDRDGAIGTVYGVRQDGRYIGTVCLIAGEEDDFTISLPDEVLNAFKRLTWPKSTVGVQPRGGQTLVNLDTIFYTDNAAPSTATVTLVGRRVTIEAAPVQYLWRFGDGTTSTTTSPGFPYEEGQEVLVEGRVTHRYERVTDAVSVSVDTTYRGRYRVGDGPWQPIAETLTVAGDDVELEVLEARPQLVR